MNMPVTKLAHNMSNRVADAIVETDTLAPGGLVEWLLSLI